MKAIDRDGLLLCELQAKAFELSVCSGKLGNICKKIYEQQNGEMVG